MLVLHLNSIDVTLFDRGFDSRSNTFKEREDDVDHPMNTNDPLRVPNGPIIRSKVKTLEEAFNELVMDVSAKAELGDHLEHQEKVLVHLIHVKFGSIHPYLGHKVLTTRLSILY